MQRVQSEPSIEPLVARVAAGQKLAGLDVGWHPRPGVIQLRHNWSEVTDRAVIREVIDAYRRLAAIFLTADQSIQILTPAGQVLEVLTRDSNAGTVTL